MSTIAALYVQPAWWFPVKSLEEVSFVGESRAVVKLVGIEISGSLDKISLNEGYSEQTLRQTERGAMQGAASNGVT
jgi:hypothetical protein